MLRGAKAEQKGTEQSDELGWHRLMPIGPSPDFYVPILVMCPLRQAGMILHEIRECLRDLMNNSNNTVILENLQIQNIFSSRFTFFLKNRFLRLVLGLDSLCYARKHTSGDCS